MDPLLPDAMAEEAQLAVRLEGLLTHQPPGQAQVRRDRSWGLTNPTNCLTLSGPKLSCPQGDENLPISSNITDFLPFAVLPPPASPLLTLLTNQLVTLLHPIELSLIPGDFVIE